MMKNLPILSLVALALAMGASAHAADTALTTIATQPATRASTAKLGKIRGKARTHKSRMGVRIAYTVDSPTAGTPGQVALTVTRPEGGPALDIEVKADPTLTLVGGLPGGKVSQTLPVASYSMTVTPQGNGLHYLHVFLHQGASAEALAIPLQVGKGSTVAKPSKAVTMPDGQRVISMPAQQ